MVGKYESPTSGNQEMKNLILGIQRIVANISVYKWIKFHELSLPRLYKDLIRSNIPGR